ncbi:MULTISPECIES: hypothetical protein [Acinetobacter]|uniref:hypothetical protein n=1 Tax=Acinetobacter TaxID=469 RepID=UPI001D0D7961|nr:hypothetical protein [Acinetobacter genomosp. 33YU]
MKKTILKLAVKWLQLLTTTLLGIAVFYWIFGPAIFGDDMSRGLIFLGSFVPSIFIHLATTQEIDEWFDEKFRGKS